MPLIKDYIGGEESSARQTRVAQDDAFAKQLPQLIKKFKAGLPKTQQAAFTQIIDGMLPYYEIGRKSPRAMDNDKASEHADAVRQRREASASEQLRR